MVLDMDKPVDRDDLAQLERNITDKLDAVVTQIKTSAAHTDELNRLKFETMGAIQKKQELIVEDHGKRLDKHDLTWARLVGFAVGSGALAGGLGASIASLIVGG